MYSPEKKQKTSKTRPHPYLHGNFAPIHRTLPLTACAYTGHIPDELVGGEYVRNGGNPLTNEDLGRDAHWFDGDGMLSGVLFRRGRNGAVEPAFVNQYILTDVFISSLTTPSLRTPILPSIATLVNPLASLLTIVARILRTVLLVLLSFLPGSSQAIRRISVANTSLVYHDGRALATCESGPPMRVALPGLETVGWYDGGRAENEPAEDEPAETKTQQVDVLGGSGPLAFLREWTTAHPRVDPVTDELLLFHSTFVPPYVRYSIVPASSPSSPRAALNLPVPGIASPKMMHDFGASATHTVILDLPLSLDPLALMRNQPVVAYDPLAPSRFGVFPRHHPEQIRWFETAACCTFHVANTWDAPPASPDSSVTAVNMLSCRLTSASLVFSAGDIAAPAPSALPASQLVEDEQCRLYYHQFPLAPSSREITHEWALSSIPFEFPTTHPSSAMGAARYVYGCTTQSSTSFSASLGRAVKIDALAKIDALSLIDRGTAHPPRRVTGCVDTRSVADVLASTDPEDPIQVFALPDGWYAQEPRFVPRRRAVSEDDGWLLSYVFDESQLDERGEAKSAARSELWVIDARGMTDVVARVRLPQRVPYGLHGAWFSEGEIGRQRAFEGVRSVPARGKTAADGGLWTEVRRMMLEWLA